MGTVTSTESPLCKTFSFKFFIKRNENTLIYYVPGAWFCHQLAAPLQALVA
jgi:hypothetical protein